MDQLWEVLVGKNDLRSGYIVMRVQVKASVEIFPTLLVSLTKGRIMSPGGHFVLTKHFLTQKNWRKQKKNAWVLE